MIEHTQPKKPMITMKFVKCISISCSLWTILGHFAQRKVVGFFLSERASKQTERSVTILPLTSPPGKRDITNCILPKNPERLYFLKRRGRIQFSMATDLLSAQQTSNMSQGVRLQSVSKTIHSTSHSEHLPPMVHTVTQTIHHLLMEDKVCYQ